MVKEVSIDPIYLKIGLMVAAFLGLYLLARGSTRKGPEETAPEPASPVPAPIRMSSAADSNDGDPTFAPIAGADQFADKVVIQQHSFRTFDPVPGPPDPSDFMDDLLVRAYYPDTGGTTDFVFTVTTPKALAREIAAAPSKCYSPPAGCFIVDRYDHDVIMHAVLKYLFAQQQEDGDTSDDPDPVNEGRKFGKFPPTL